MSPGLTPSSFRLTGDLMLLFYEAAEKGARVMARYGRRNRPRRGLTLKPGPATPLWNELIKEAQPLVRKRGSKARLARFLGLPRQRLQDCVKAKNTCLDAERTLLLLCWIMAQRQGRDLDL